MHTSIEQKTIKTPPRRVPAGHRHAGKMRRIPAAPHRPDPSGLSRETLRQIVLDLIG